MITRKARIRGKAVCALSLVLVVLFASCYPEREATFVEKKDLDTVTVVRAPAKVFLADASVALFPNGFKLKEDTLLGEGWRYSAIGTMQNTPVDKMPRRRLQIPRDSTVAMTYYDELTTGGRAFASILLTLPAAALTAVALYCIANPKACFGCCPTVYTENGDGWDFQAELFSYSISRLLESEDLDKVGEHVSSGSPFTLRVANEALETHSINWMELVAVRHAAGTVAFPTVDGGFVAVGDMQSPLWATNSEGRDVLQLVRFWDDQAYRSDTTMVRQVKTGRSSDWIDLRVQPPRGSRSATLVVRLKNTLLSTVLFYEVVLGTQGVQAIDWTQRMNSDPVYASLFRSVYSEFSGVKIMVHRDGVWSMVGGVPDAGPVGWKPVAVKVPVENDEELLLRMQFFPDNMMIDYLAFSYDTEERQIDASVVPPVAVRDRTGEFRSDILPLIESKDGRYLLTEPRDVYRFMYNLPAAEGFEMSLFVRSKGYYTEWIRGTWICSPLPGRSFDLFHINQTMTRLADLWIKERGSMESLFFRNRIPVAEDL